MEEIAWFGDILNIKGPVLNIEGPVLKIGSRSVFGTSAIGVTQQPAGEDLRMT